MSALKSRFEACSKTWQRILLLSLGTTVLVLADAIYFAVTGGEVYDNLQKEDGVVEYLTALFFFAAGVIFIWAVMAKTSPVKDIFRDQRFLLAILGLLCIYAALEEISFGQRIIGWESPDFFKENSTQEETDTHNIEGTEFIFAIAAAVLLIYGVLVPLGLKYLPERFEWFREFFGMKIPYPPVLAAITFFLGGLFIILDFVSKALGNQIVGNEYQEFLFGYAFLLFALYLFDPGYQGFLSPMENKEEESKVSSS